MTTGSDTDVGKNGSDAPLVTGQVVVVEEVPPFSGATIHVYLEDISRADTTAILIAETTIKSISHKPSNAGKKSKPARSKSGKTTIPFVLQASPAAPKIEQRNIYSVRVWVDQDSDGKRGPGDLYSDQTYPVLTRGFGNAISVELAARD